MINSKNEEDIKIIVPPNHGWIEKKLSRTEINYLWECIDNEGESEKKELAGNIHESNKLIDRNDWFFANTILPLCKKYCDEFFNLGDNIPINQRHPYYLSGFWVNYQKQNEFNPMHDHNGIYSFVIWMKIPTKYSEQNKNRISSLSSSPRISAFQFHYTDILGKMTEYTYEMNPDIEGTLVFFPSKLRHCVYPFYNCTENRVSIAGNLSLNTTIKI